MSKFMEGVHFAEEETKRDPLVVEELLMGVQNNYDFDVGDEFDKGIQSYCTHFENNRETILACRRGS